jgi:eukaryotic-like serine/threonine-protein kinase
MSEGQDTPGVGNRTGTLLSTRYELQALIGNGGMGEVWRASDTLLSRPVAVKLLHARHMADETSRMRFRTEGRITAVLSHPGIAQVYDYGEQGDHAYLVMELVPGESLSGILERNTGGLEPTTVLDIIDQVARALGAAHARGVVHRDLKPGNLLVTEDGSVKLTDFGIARGNESLGLTQTGMVMGTAQYISPEQASGQAATPASDLYSLGVVAYECLVGAPPFHAESPVALALAHVRETPPPLPERVPTPLRTLVDELLSKDPAQRPGSTTELVQRIQEARSAVPSLSTAPTMPLAAIAGAGAAAAPRTDDPATRPGQASGTTQPNPPVPPLHPSGDDGSVRLSGTSESGFRWRRRWVVIAIAALVVIAIGTALLAQLFDGGGEDATPQRGEQDGPTPVRGESESEEPADDEPHPEGQDQDFGTDTGGSGGQPQPTPEEEPPPDTDESPEPPDGQDNDVQPPDEGDGDNDPGDTGGDTDPDAGDDQRSLLPSP